jgi:serine/threonine-protein kinase
VADLVTGTAIAGYRIEAVLGSGSMGTVYSALDVALERRVALKVLTPELARDERFRERFLRESKLAASLEHPHIVPIHSAGEADGLLYLAMRYIDGQDLAALLRNLGRLDPERTLAILDQVAAALDVAHARGLVHRDVKPANIMLTRHGDGDDYAYLCDFGLAKHTSTVSSLTGSRAIVGTVDYLAPEQIEGRPVDGRADVYALGCVLYECLTGVSPYDRGNELASLLAHVNDPAPVLSERRADLPPVLDTVVATALAKDREQRYATGGALVEAVRAALRGEEPTAPEPRAESAASVRTFLFADVRGYTAYTREHGDEAAAELAASFAALVRDLAPAHAGTMQEVRGDEVLVVFDSARQALRFAVALLAKVAESGLARPVGIGLDAGEAVSMEDGFRGTALNRAARLCALARPGEILASDGVRELAGATPGVAYGFRSVERLKGFDAPVGVVEIHSAEAAPGRQLRRRALRAFLGTRPRARLAAGVVVLIAAGVAVPLLLRSGGSGSAAAKPGTVALLDGKTMKPVASFSDAGAPAALISDSERHLLALDVATASIARIDPQARKVTARFPLNVSPGGIAWAAGSLWVGDADHAAVVRYDPQYGTISARIPLPTGKLDNPDVTNWLAFGAGSVWVSYGQWPFRLARIDPTTNRVAKTFDLGRAEGRAAIAFGDRSLWVASQDTGRLWRIDASTDAVVAQGKLHGGWVEDIRVVNGYAWLPVENDRGVWKVDAGGNIVKNITTGDLPYSLSDDGTHLYVVNQKSATLSRIDTRTDAVETVSVGHRPEAVAVAGGLLWVPLNESPADAVVGLGGKKVVHIVTDGDPLYNTDPATMEAGGAQNMLHGAIDARLLRFPDVAQPRGSTLLPEVSDLPSVSNAGRTYTFRIRPRYRFSPPSHALVTAESMRFSIERALSPKITDPLAQAYNIVGDIVGLKAYRDGRASHISGIRVSGDDLSITLVEPAPDFPTRISLNWFAAVPIGTPILPHGVDRPIPSAGPYYVSAHVGDLEEVVRRNPNYTGPRPHALEAFVFENGVDTAALPDRVSGGSADYVWGDGRQFALGGPLDRRYGSAASAAKRGGPRYFAPQTMAIRYFDYNTARGIFRDPKVRQAVNYVLDRPALASIFDGRPAASPIPPGVPGAGASIPYPVGKPDVARARALAGTAHRTVTLYARSNGPDDATTGQAVAVLRQDLARLGMTVRVRRFDDPWGAAAKPNAPVDLLLNAWYADYADPSDFINVIFDSHPLGYGYPVPYELYADPIFLKEMRRVYLVEGAGRAAAYRNLVARMMRESPPAAVFQVPRTPAQLFSGRLGCQLFRPQDHGYVDLAALCLAPQG